jgi:hypothetical protein
MNYTEIVLNGYIQTESKFLHQYFIDEAKKTTNYEMFFSGCNNVVGSFKKYLKKQMYEYKKEITESLQGHKEDCNINDIKEHEQILKDLKIEDFEVDLSGFAQFKFVGSIPYFAIINIEQSIETAKIELIDIPLIAEKSIEIIKKRKKPTDNYSDLYNKLIKKYFSDISESDFIEVLKYQRLPNGKEKIKWIKDNRADAFRFKEYINFTVKQMNYCFSFPFKKLEGHHKPKHKATKTDLSRILKELQPKK